MDTDKKDLVILVADKNMEYAIKGLLERTHSLNIRAVTFDIFIHPGSDPGCLIKGPTFMRPLKNKYHYALLIFDKFGCGRERLCRTNLESSVGKQMRLSGWDDRAEVIVIDPELENWIWSYSPVVSEQLGWKGKHRELMQTLTELNYIDNNTTKPAKPKEAAEYALKRAGKPRSSSIYFKIAQKASLTHCTDPSFNKLKNTLHRWFPVSPEPYS